MHALRNTKRSHTVHRVIHKCKLKLVHAKDPYTNMIHTQTTKKQHTSHHCMVDPKKKGLADIHQGINKFVFVPYRTHMAFQSNLLSSCRPRHQWLKTTSFSVHQMVYWCLLYLSPTPLEFHNPRGFLQW